MMHEMRQKWKKSHFKILDFKLEGLNARTQNQANSKRSQVSLHQSPD